MSNSFIKSPGDRFHSLTYSVPYEVNTLHGHSFWEFTIITRGRAYNIVNDVSQLVEKGDMFLLSPNDRHYFKVLTKKQYEHRDLYVLDEDFKKLCDTIDDNIYQKLCSNGFFKMPLGEDTLHNIEKRLRHLQLSDSANPSNEAKAIHRSIVTYLLGLIIENTANADKSYPKWLVGLLADMNKTEIICDNLSAVTALTYYSAEHLSREFHKLTGQRLIEYHTIKKMELAISLLTHTEYSILEISSSIGYDSLSHFIHNFKKHYNVSPGAYRKSIPKN